MHRALVRRNELRWQRRAPIDPSFVITHTLPLDEAPRGYRMFRDKHDECIKVVLKP